MTIERLEELISYLYREADEESPFSAEAGKNEWMAQKIECDLQENNGSLRELLARDNITSVLDYLEEQYEELVLQKVYEVR